jgi:asparagine synthase (glutamine-hydrolysing)
MKTYLIASVSADTPAGDERLSRLRAEAEAAGMVVKPLSPRAWLAVSGSKSAPTVSVGAWTLLGDVFNRDAAPVRRVPHHDPYVYEKKMIARFWGRYVAIRLDAGGAPAAVVRDPSGALDCVSWTSDGLTLIASDLPSWLSPTCRQGWRIDRERVEAALHDPYGTAGALLLDGPTAVLPGTLQPLPEGIPVALWRPDWIARSAEARSDAEAADALRKAVDESVAGFSRLGGVLACEISGGLDSSIVAESLVRSGKDHTKLWLNAWGPDPSADERPWVTSLAEHLAIAATTVPRAVGRVTPAFLEAIPQGFRPGLAALDTLHDADWARRFETDGIDRVLTGKGGDSMFVQPADIGVFVDLWRERGWRAFFLADTVRLARWNERSVWTLVQAARRRDWRPQSVDAPNGLLRPRTSPNRPRHPWLDGIDDLGPAKRRQILGLVQGVMLHGASLQTQAAAVIHPLLSQPVVETCLALPTPQLTLGRRDRGLARRAFADRLPASITTRRSKGEMTAFYGRMIAEGLDVLRPWLLDGRLAAMGLIDRQGAEGALTRESLAWRGGYVDIMVTAAIEGWVRAWERRLSLA